MIAAIRQRNRTTQWTKLLPNSRHASLQFSETRNVTLKDVTDNSDQDVGQAVQQRHQKLRCCCIQLTTISWMDEQQEGHPACKKSAPMKKSARGRRTHCALALVRRIQNFRPAADPFPGAQDGQNLISWRWSLPSPTDPVWWGSIHAISSYRGNRPTNKQRNAATHPHTGPITIHCAPAS